MSVSKSNITGKVALITGGLGAIGFTYAKHLISHGIKGIVLADNTTKINVNEKIEELERHGKGDIIFENTNVDVRNDLRNAFEIAAKKFGNLDIFINCAGILDESHWNRMITTNFISGIAANFMAMKEYLPKYRDGAEATIVNTICVNGLQPLQSMAVYSTTKAGMLGLHKALSHPHWYSTYRCRFLAICPGLTRTPMLKNMAAKGIDLDLFDEECYEFPIQDTKYCGMCLIDALKLGKNGSIWICENSKMYEWTIPDRLEVRKQMKQKDVKKNPDS